MEQKKYKLTKETMCFDGVTLHRIQALKDFGNVEAGELGGWVESEKNLSQSGDCWIAMEAKAYGGAEIGDSAILTRKAIACGNSTKGDDYHYEMVKSHTSKADKYEKVVLPNMPTHWMKMPTHPQ